MLRYHPLLRHQRDLYDVPRGPQRFRAYLSLMLNEAQNEMELPLGAFNPMGREAVAARLDEWIKLGADEIAATAIGEVREAQRELEGDFRLALVLCDDNGGAWTNHASTEFSRRFETGALLRRGWIEGSLWTSQQPSPQLAREAILVAFYRAIHIARHGAATTLQQMLTQEEFAARHAGQQRPTPAPIVVEQVCRIVEEHANSVDWSIQMACLFGDDIALELGLTPLGMPPGGALCQLIYGGSEI